MLICGETVDVAGTECMCLTARTAAGGDIASVLVRMERGAGEPLSHWINRHADKLRMIVAAALERAENS